MTPSCFVLRVRRFTVVHFSRDLRLPPVLYYEFQFHCIYTENSQIICNIGELNVGIYHTIVYTVAISDNEIRSATTCAVSEPPVSSDGAQNPLLVAMFWQMPLFVSEPRGAKTSIAQYYVVLYENAML